MAIKWWQWEMGEGRIYEGGRTTKNWKRGAKIEAFSALKDGMILIKVNHRFKGENLIQIRGFSEIDPQNIAHCRYILPDGEIYGPEEMSIHAHEVNADSEKVQRKDEEFFVAVWDGPPVIKPKRRARRKAAEQGALLFD